MDKITHNRTRSFFSLCALFSSLLSSSILQAQAYARPQQYSHPQTYSYSQNYSPTMHAQGPADYHSAYYASSVPNAAQSNHSYGQDYGNRYGNEHASPCGAPPQSNCGVPHPHCGTPTHHQPHCGVPSQPCAAQSHYGAPHRPTCGMPSGCTMPPCDPMPCYAPCLGVEPCYAGIEYKLITAKAQGEWSRIFGSTHSGPGVFFGGRFCSVFGLTSGLELGYNWSVEKRNSTVIPNGASILGVTNTSGVPIVAIGKVRFKTWYLDYKLYVPVLLGPYFQCFYPELVLTAGVGSSKATMNVYSITVGTPTGPNPLNPQLYNIIGATQATLRAGFGFQSMIWNYVGIRAMARWESFSRLRGRSQGFETENRKIFKDGLSIGLGMYITFLPF